MSELGSEPSWAGSKPDNYHYILRSCQRLVGWINDPKSPRLRSSGSGKESKTNWKTVFVYNYYIQVLDLNFKNFWQGKEVQEASTAPVHRDYNHNNHKRHNLGEDWETARKPKTKDWWVREMRIPKTYIYLGPAKRITLLHALARSKMFSLEPIFKL